MSDSAEIILLYCVAALVAIASRRLRVPYTAALLVSGIVLGSLPFPIVPHLTRTLLFDVFLPGLLFEAAWHLELHELRASALTIGLLAVPGVVLAIALTAAILVAGSSFLPGVSATGWHAALLFGAVIAATDPVAVTALFREQRVPRRLHVLVESESLLNDGTSIVFLTLLLSFFAGETPTASLLGASFVRIVAGGVGIGAAIGYGVAHLRRTEDDAHIAITLGTVAAYGSFLLAEHVHCSGVMATVAAGVVFGWIGRRHAMSPVTHATVTSFWEWLAFALNSGVFLLLGAEISVPALVREWPMLLLGAFAALGARALVVSLVLLVTSRTRERMPAAWGVILGWGGLRGALSLVLALSLPPAEGARALIIGMTAGTVTLSLLVQGGSMRAVLRRLRLGDAS